MMKKFFLTIISLMLSVSLLISSVNLCAFAATGEKTETGQQMYVVGGSKTNVRAGASTEYDVVATLYGNTAVIQLSTSGAWSYIRYDDDQYGYISTSRLASEPENTTGTVMYVSSTQITLYAEPNTSCEETIGLSHGIEVEDRGNYYETSFHVICYEGGTWYLYNADSKLSATNTDTEQQMYVVGGSKTNVREGSSTQYDIVATLYGNTEVTLIYTSGSWSYIRYDDDQYGYISTSRLAEEPENTTGTAMYVSSTQITLYAEPDTSCEETMVLSHGTEVEDRGIYYDTSFHVIGYEGGTWYLYNADSKLSETNTDTEQQMYVVGGSKTNVREGPSTQYDIVATLYGNTEITLVYTSGSWSYIRYDDDQYGYISTSRLAEEPENMTGTIMQVALAQITLYAEPNTSCEEKVELDYGTEVEDRGTYYDTSFNVIYYEGKTWFLYGAENRLAGDGTIDLTNLTRYVVDLCVLLYEETNSDSEYIYVPYRSEVKYLGDAVIGNNGKWIKIEYDQTVGYIYQSYDNEEVLSAASPGDLSYQSNNIYAQEILDAAVNVYLNMTTQYEYGGLSEEPDENGIYYFDCIGFIIFVYRNVLEQYVPVTNLDARITSMYELQYLFNEGLNGEAAVQDVAFEDMQPGDILFMYLDGDEVSEDELNESSDDVLVPTHVAIYLGNNEFIHCTHYEWGTGVYISPLNEHYSEATIAVRRIVPEEIETAEEKRYVSVSSNTNVRAAASGSAEIITSLYGNTEVTVLFTNDQWAYIRYGEDQYGYITAAHLVTEPENVIGTSKYVSSAQITLYSEPSSSCEKTLTLSCGTEVEDRGVYYDSDFHVIGYNGETWYLYNADSKLSEDKVYDEEQMYVAVASLVNVREKASASSNIVAKLYGNTKVTLLSMSNSWSYIRFGDNEYGYIATKYLASEPENTTGTLKLVSASSITLYAEPSTSCTDTLVLDSGTEVEDRGQYYSTAFNVISYGDEAWYLYNASSKLSEKVMYVSGVANLNVREGAGTSYAVVAQLYGNTEVVQLSISGSWSYIRFGDGEYGYIATKYLASEPKNTTGTLKLVSASSITLYAEPSTSCTDTLVLNSGTEVEDRGQYYSTAFNVISYGDETWYLYNASSKLSEKVMYVSGVANLNVREGAGTSYAVVAQLYGNTEVVQLSISGSWSYIRFGDNEYGYTSTKYLASEPENTTGTLKLVSASSITLYAEPTTNCIKTLALNSGTEVEDRGQYYSTAFNVIGYEGETWYLYNASSKLSEKIMYVSGVSRANVRVGPSTLYDIITKLDRNTEVTQLSTSGAWSYIRFGDGEYGYISTSYISSVPDNIT